MIQQDQLRDIMGARVEGPDGQKIGTVGQVYLDDDSGNPEWITVSTGLFGTKESFVPLSDATYSDGCVRVPVDKDTVKGAPQMDADGHLDRDQENELYRYYGLSSSGTMTTGDTYDTTGGVGTGYDDRVTRDDAVMGTAAGVGGVAGTYDRDDTVAGTVDRDADRVTTEGDSASVTRSEEHLNVGTETREAGRARLRKYVVSDEQTVTVPVTREEVRVEREPVSGAEAGAIRDTGEEEVEVTLHEEVPVVSKETEAVERVRLSTDEVQDTETVTEEVRKEQIDTDGVVTDRDADMGRDRDGRGL